MMLCKSHPNTRFQKFQDGIVPAIVIVSKYHKVCAALMPLSSYAAKQRHTIAEARNLAAICAASGTPKK
jgi:hypothetical protein